jgi:biopolymer transport protein ExbD
MSKSAHPRSPSTTTDPAPLMEMNMTPLIDVMLVLIIMLIITIPKQNHSINMNMPTGKTPQHLVNPSIVTIDVDFDGRILWDNSIISDRATLESKLSTVATAEEQPEVHLRPNKLAEYKHVAAILASAQRIGVTKIGLVGNEQFQ